MHRHLLLVIYIQCCAGALMEPVEFDLKNIGVRNNAQNLNYCEASYRDWLLAISCDATTQPYNIDFFIDDAPKPQELYILDIPSVVSKTLSRPNMYYIDTPSINTPARITIRDAGPTSQSITVARANSHQDNLTHLHVNIGDVMEFQKYKLKNIKQLTRTNRTSEVSPETRALIKSSYVSKATRTNEMQIPTTPRDTFVQKSEDLVDLNPETYDIYDDNLMKIIRKQIINTQKTGNKYVDVIQMSCCGSSQTTWNHKVSTLYYQGQNSMKNYIVKRGLKYGDKIYNTNEIIKEEKFPDSSKIGVSYKMVIFDKDANDISETSFTIILYQWQVVYQQGEYQVQMQELKSKQYLKYWSLLNAKLTWDVMAVIANYNRIKIFTMDDLREINSISNEDGQIQNRFGIEVIQRQNMLLEFHVETQKDSEDAYLIMNKLIFTQNTDGSLPDLKKNSNPASFIWSRHIKVSKIKLNMFTQIASLMGGMSIGWLDKTQRKFKALRICSQNEFYSSKTDTCHKCFEKTKQFPNGKLNFLENSKDSQTYMDDNGYSPYYSSSVQDPKCYSCSQLEFFKSYDLNAYMDFKFLCLHGDDFMSESSERNIKGNTYVPTENDQFMLMDDISDHIATIEQKKKEQKGIVDVTMSFFKSLRSDQKNLMLVIIVGLSVCACCSMFCFWCCRDRQSIDDTTDEEEHVGNNNSANPMVNQPQKSPAKVKLIKQESEERQHITAAIKNLLKIEQFKSDQNIQTNDTSCSICMENFTEDLQIVQTPCNHSFHSDCLMDWINVRIDKILKEKRKQINQANPVDAPDCPNCNQSLTKAAEAVEREAINQINQIGGLLSSSVSIVDHNDVQAQV